jgi:hypothetical protein
MDAAWVAERLLTTEELKAEVDLHWPDEGHGAAPVESLLYGEPIAAGQIPPSMRHLLARRLAREGRIDEAMVYFPETLRGPATALQDSQDKAQDLWRRDDVRGTHMWEAAYLSKQQGWALLATEMEPDFRVLGGYYEGAYTLDKRLAPTPPAPLFATQPEELAKLAKTAPPKEKRYHFVWTAAEQAEEAVRLMKDDNPQLDQALCTSGLWQRSRDPSYSDRAFKALASRVPDSPLNGASVYLDPANMGQCQPTPPTVSKGCQSKPGGGTWAIAGLVLLCLRRSRRTAQS